MKELDSQSCRLFLRFNLFIELRLVSLAEDFAKLGAFGQAQVFEVRAGQERRWRYFGGVDFGGAAQGRRCA